MFRKFLAGNFLIAGCAVALSFQTAWVSGVAIRQPTFYCFIFLATLTTYRLHAFKYSDATGRAEIVSLLISTFVAASGLPAAMLPWIALAACLAVSYSLPILPGRRRLREFGLPKILALTGVWTLVTAYLPSLGYLHGAALWILLTRRSLFIFAIALVFDIRDREIDCAAGIRTLAVRLGSPAAFVVMRLSLLAFALSIFASPSLHGLHSPADAVSVALLLSAMITWAVLEKSRRGVSPNYYHACIDSMMLVQGALVAGAAWISRVR